jgi:hypothetical protein
MNNALQNVGWNTLATLGVALTSGTVTYGVNTFSHTFFDVKEKTNESYVIRLLAVAAGAAAGLFALHNVAVIHVDFGQSYVTAHALSVIMGVYCSAVAYMIAFGTDKTSMVLHLTAASLTLGTPFISSFGKTMLIPAAGIGAAVGAYL